MIATTLIQVNSVEGNSIEKINIFECAGDKKHFRNSICKQVNGASLYVDAKPDEYDVVVLITPKEIGKTQNIINEVKRNARIEVIADNIARLSLREKEIGYYLGVKCMSGPAIVAMGKYDNKQVKDATKSLYEKCDVHKIGFFIAFFNRHYTDYLPPVLVVVYKKKPAKKKNCKKP